MFPRELCQTEIDMITEKFDESLASEGLHDDHHQMVIFNLMSIRMNRAYLRARDTCCQVCESTCLTNSRTQEDKKAALSELKAAAGKRQGGRKKKEEEEAKWDPYQGSPTAPRLRAYSLGPG